MKGGKDYRKEWRKKEKQKQIQLGKLHSLDFEICFVGKTIEFFETPAEQKKLVNLPNISATTTAKTEKRQNVWILNGHPCQYYPWS